MNARLIARVAGVLLSTLGVAAEEPSLAQMKAKYDEQLLAMDRVYEAVISNAPTRYVQALQALEKKYTADGNLDGVLAVRNERLRFEVDKALAETDLVATPPELVTEQAVFLDVPKRADMERTRNAASLDRQYVVALERLKVQLTKSGQIQDALAVKAEVERIGPLAQESRPAIPRKSLGSSPLAQPKDVARPPSVDWEKLASRVAGATAKRTNLLSSDKSAKYTETPAGGAVLAGFDLTMTPFKSSSSTVRGLRAVYLTKSGTLAGAQHGARKGVETLSVIAKPGYAVGKLTAQYDDVAIRRLKVHFQRMAGDRLMARDEYESAWFGVYDPKLTREATIDTQGHLPIGIYGSSGAGLDGLGLIYFME